MTKAPETLAELTLAATEEVDNEPARLTLRRLVLSAATCAVALLLFTVIGSQGIDLVIELVTAGCNAVDAPLCGGFWNPVDETGQ